MARNSHRYSQGYKDRGDESRGMKKKYRGGMDEGYMGMISEDHSAVANMPQNVKQMAYPRTDYLDGAYLDDTIRGIDETLRDNIGTTDRYRSDSMY